MHFPQVGLKTSVSVLSDSRLFRETICSWLRRHQDIWCVAAGSLQYFLQRPEARAAEVMLVRARMDGALRWELTYEIRLLLPATRLIVLKSSDSKYDLASWIEAGAVDYLPHDASLTELLQCIREAARTAPRCSMSRHTREIGQSGQSICKSVYSNEDFVAAEPFVVRELDTVLPYGTGVMYKATSRQNGRNARDYDSSTIPIQ